jgi:hypothetical protein
MCPYALHSLCFAYINTGYPDTYVTCDIGEFRWHNKYTFRIYEDFFLKWMNSQVFSVLRGNSFRNTGVLPWWPEFDSISDHMGFVVDEETLGRGFSEYFGFICQISIHELLQIRKSSFQLTPWSLIAPINNQIKVKFLVWIYLVLATKMHVLPPLNIWLKYSCLSEGKLLVEYTR